MISRIAIVVSSIAHFPKPPGIHSKSYVEGWNQGIEDSNAAASNDDGTYGHQCKGVEQSTVVVPNPALYPYLYEDSFVAYATDVVIFNRGTQSRRS